MMLTSHAGVPASPMRLLEMLTDRFGVFEALAHSTIKLNRCTSADELAMDPQVAEAVLEFADDLRTARAASGAWAETKAWPSTGRRRKERMTPEREQGAEEANSRGPELAAAVVFTRVPHHLPPRHARAVRRSSLITV